MKRNSKKSSITAWLLIIFLVTLISLFLNDGENKSVWTAVHMAAGLLTVFGSVWHFFQRSRAAKKEIQSGQVPHPVRRWRIWFGLGLVVLAVAKGTSGFLYALFGTSGGFSSIHSYSAVLFIFLLIFHMAARPKKAKVLKKESAQLLKEEISPDKN